MVGRRLIEERELACDQTVLEQAGAEDYAEGILNALQTNPDVWEMMRSLLIERFPQKYHVLKTAKCRFLRSRCCRVVRS